MREFMLRLWASNDYLKHIGGAAAGVKCYPCHLIFTCTANFSFAAGSCRPLALRVVTCEFGLTQPRGDLVSTSTRASVRIAELLLTASLSSCQLGHKARNFKQRALSSLPEMIKPGPSSFAQFAVIPRSEFQTEIMAGHIYILRLRWSHYRATLIGCIAGCV